MIVMSRIDKSRIVMSRIDKSRILKSMFVKSTECLGKDC